MDINTLIQHEFGVSKDIIYLNHAAVSPWPLRTREAVITFARENFHQGSLRYPQWLQTETSLRKKLQALIRAPSSDDIALVKNTSEALSLVAYGLPWQRGDNIVITNQEFPSNRIVWQSLASLGVELRIADVSFDIDNDPEMEIFNLCDRQTRLVSVSSVQYASGLKMDLARIGDFCQSNNILFCIDAIQSVGAVNFDVQDCHASFAMADGHKWMLGPEGLGFFYCDENVRDQLRLTQFGWHMIENVGNYDEIDWQVAHSARRFECGSPNMLGIHALNASLSLILELDIKEIEKKIRANSQLMIDTVGNDNNLELVSTSSLDRLAGIVTFRHKNHESNVVYENLMKQKIMCAARGGGIRFSPHFYTAQDQIQQALQQASKI